MSEIWSERSERSEVICIKVCRDTRVASLYFFAFSLQKILKWTGFSSTTHNQRSLRALWLQSLSNGLVPAPRVSSKSTPCFHILITSYRSFRPYLLDIYPKWQAIGYSRIEQRGQSLRDRLGWGTYKSGRLSGEQYRNRCYCRLGRKRQSARLG